MIKEARIKANLSRAEMSRQFEIPVRTLEDWESGKRTPPTWAEKLIIEKLKEKSLLNGIVNFVHGNIISRGFSDSEGKRYVMLNEPSFFPESKNIWEEYIPAGFSIDVVLPGEIFYDGLLDCTTDEYGISIRTFRVYVIATEEEIADKQMCDFSSREIHESHERCLAPERFQKEFLSNS